MGSSYAWIIDRDHLDERSPIIGITSNKGMRGPSDAPETPVPGWKAFQFRMYDDDGILYFTGRMFCKGTPDETACYGPLSDIGIANGCTSIQYPGHPEMDCE